ncbi:MAG: SUMF1/EgtB/PvdO family nonheme iron enzyme [Chloroflexi bacterium]|nr:SUMF1/EgtB/PvdO family nonheme iron enzyme [Chloroflexota bacterium]
MQRNHRLRLLLTHPHTATPAPTTGSTMTGNDGSILVYVPAGEFTMGGTQNMVKILQDSAIPWLEMEASDSEPAHVVYLDAFWIDQTEVTIGQYQQCVAAGVCLEPAPPGEYNANQFWPIYSDTTNVRKLSGFLCELGDGSHLLQLGRQAPTNRS